VQVRFVASDRRVACDQTALTSPEKDLRKSTLITNTLNVTPITIETKRSNKERRNPDIANKAEQVKNAFILLHKNHIDDRLITTAATSTSSEKNTLSVLDYSSQMCEIRQKCMNLKMEGKVKEVISLLTVAPLSWSQEVTADFFL
jgi:hypothetical protein